MSRSKRDQCDFGQFEVGIEYELTESDFVVVVAVKGSESSSNRTLRVTTVVLAQ